MKTCPFCAEEIQDAAVKCKHCGEFLDGARPAANRLPWYFSASSIALAVCCVGPLALPLLWWRPRTSTTWKLVWTAVVLALTWLLAAALRSSLDVLRETYPLLVDPAGI